MLGPIIMLVSVAYKCPFKYSNVPNKHACRLIWHIGVPETKEPDTLISFGSTQSQEKRR